MEYPHIVLLTGPSNSSHWIVTVHIVMEKVVEQHKNPWNWAHLLFTWDHEYSCPIFIISHHCHVPLAYATSLIQRSGFAVHFECWVSQNNMKIIIIKQNAQVGTFHKHYLINSYNTFKRYYYPHVLLEKLEKFFFNSAFVSLLLLRHLWASHCHHHLLLSEKITT